MNMNITETDKIDIEGISDNIRYEHMALLVDREDFILSIKNTRKFLGITTLLQHDEVDKWLHRIYKNSSFIKMNKDDKNDFKQSFYLSQSVASLKEIFHKNVNYTNAIKYAILAGKVTDKEFTKTAFCAEYPFSEEFDYLLLGG